MLQWGERTLLVLLVLLMLSLGLFELIQSIGTSPARRTHGNVFAAALLWIVMLSAMLAASAGDCGQSERLGGRKPAAAAGAAQIPGLLICAVCCLMLAWASLRYLIVDLRLGSSGPLGLPGWVPLLILPYGFSLMSARLLARALSGKQAVRAVATKDPTGRA